MYSGIPFPDIDPIAFQIGPLAIRWYSLAYLFGLLLGYFLLRRMSVYSKSTFTVLKVDDYLFYAFCGVVLGGRLGYVLFYNLYYYLENPTDIFAVWKGGMSFHGGLLGVILATILFSKIKKINLYMVADMVCAVAPVGLFLGRIANFINAELYGRMTTSVPWGIVFPTGGDMPRHPSQLYEALWEGLALFVILNYIWWRSEKYRLRYGFVSGLFFCLYGVGRLILELFREPDAHLGFLFGHLTMGQLLCLPMIAFGLWLIWRSSPRVQLNKIKENKR